LHFPIYLPTTHLPLRLFDLGVSDQTVVVVGMVVVGVVCGGGVASWSWWWGWRWVSW
jgi:hypothetical protein